MKISHAVFPSKTETSLNESGEENLCSLNLYIYTDPFLTLCIEREENNKNFFINLTYENKIHIGPRN